MEKRDVWLIVLAFLLFLSAGLWSAVHFGTLIDVELPQYVFSLKLPAEKDKDEGKTIYGYFKIWDVNTESHRCLVELIPYDDYGPAMLYVFGQSEESGKKSNDGLRLLNPLPGDDFKWKAYSSLVVPGHESVQLYSLDLEKGPIGKRRVVWPKIGLPGTTVEPATTIEYKIYSKFICLIHDVMANGLSPYESLKELKSKSKLNIPSYTFREHSKTAYLTAKWNVWFDGDDKWIYFVSSDANRLVKLPYKGESPYIVVGDRVAILNDEYCAFFDSEAPKWIKLELPENGYVSCYPYSRGIIITDKRSITTTCMEIVKNGKGEYSLQKAEVFENTLIYPSFNAGKTMFLAMRNEPDRYPVGSDRYCTKIDFLSDDLQVIGFGYFPAFDISSPYYFLPKRETMLYWDGGRADIIHDLDKRKIKFHNFDDKSNDTITLSEFARLSEDNQQKVMDRATGGSYLIDEETPIIEYFENGRKLRSYKWNEVFPHGKYVHSILRNYVIVGDRYYPKPGDIVHVYRFNSSGKPVFNPFHRYD